MTPKDAPMNCNTYPLYSATLLTVLIMAGASPLTHAADSDGDGINDLFDNCSQIANPLQIDADDDGFGNRCDPDLNNSGIVNFADVAIFSGVYLSADPVADFDSSGAVNFIDFSLVADFYLSPPGPGAVIPTYTADAQPIFADKCAPCHTSLGSGGHNIGSTYADAFLDANNPSCAGLNVAQCALIRIQNGSMPRGAGCTGDPVLDVGNSACLSADQQFIIQAWIDGGLPE
ncbi:MAG: hypothetical protein HKN70_14485 [Gammaproteobacteria bacterium]|nr:hypothetical protein [Gammaproteobacteria bacterium]